MEVLKVGMLDVGSKPTLQEKLGLVSSLEIVCCCARDGVYGENVSQSFLSI